MKIFLNDRNKRIQVVLSEKLIDIDFSLSAFEEAFEASEDVIQSNRNTLKKVDFGGVKTVIKSFKVPNKIQGFIYRYFRKSKARRSYEYSFFLNKLSVNTPQPLGFIEVYQGFRLRKSYFISSLLDYDYLIRDVLNDEVDNKSQLLKEFVAFTYHMHSNGILHLDYSTGNVCVKKTEGEYHFYLVDINRMKFGAISAKKGCCNFARMSSELKDMDFFANEYAKLTGSSPQVCQKSLSSAVQKGRRYRDYKRKLKGFFKDFKTVSPSSYFWSNYSDQPGKIRDKKFKRKLYFLSFYPSLKVLLTSFLLPLFAIVLVFTKRTLMGEEIKSMGLCVNIDSSMPAKLSPSNEQLVSMVEDLGVKDILVRIPLADFDNIERYFSLVESFSGKQVLVNILQDRHHINDLSLAKIRLREIFLRLQYCVKDFQIGNTVNRRKWAFISQDEYFDFFELAQNLKKEEFTSINLLGGNIIDFELPYYLRSLFHFRDVFYNGVAAQLYVDRRGAPENRQFGFDIISKINAFYLIMRASLKSRNKLYITEVNWPLKGMKDWAPAQGEYMVDESLQAAYLVRYYLMMFASGRVEKCYWHQLVAPGYGLINNLNGVFVKRDAYYCYKFLIKIFDGGITQSFTKTNHLYRLLVETEHAYVQALWTKGDDVVIKVKSGQSVINMRGETLSVDQDVNVCASGDVIYLIDAK
ncbi:MAG: lipopolysaccharide kinase InaA family protein [Pseudomonadales bacterium]|nr:lipopolysaccharide kinase InaA family protein [Pseudomonadales bacterium]